MRRPHWTIHNPTEMTNPLKLRCLTMIDPATGWFDMAQKPNKRTQKLQILPRKLGLLVIHSHSELCLIVVPKLWLDSPRCDKMTMASKGNQLQLEILSPMQLSNESIKILEISSAHLTCPIASTTIQGLVLYEQPCLPSVQLMTQHYKHLQCN